MELFQKSVVFLRNRVCERGWAFLIKRLSRICPLLREYRAEMLDGDYLYLDLTQPMCMGYFFYGELPHERGIKEFIKHSLSVGATFVDIGANIGYYTRMASHVVGTEGNVFAFEPLPEAFRILNKNTSDLKNTKIFSIALGDMIGLTDFYVHPSGDQSSVCAFKDSIRKMSVPIIPLDDKSNLFSRLDLMKIDVEGYELSVLKGSKSLIEIYQPVIIFEFLQKYKAAYQFDISDFEKFFSSINVADYKLYRANPDDGKLVSLDFGGNDIIAVPSNKLNLFK